VHYRKPITYSLGRLEDARRSLQRLDRCVRSLMQIRAGRPCPEVGQLSYDLRQGLRRGFDDDLNLPAAVAALFQVVKRINSLMAGNLLDAQGAGRLIAVLRELDSVLGIFDFDDSATVDSQTRELIQARERARAEGNWPLADELRREILARGVTLQDSKVMM
ncbi:MAG: DALR domain-containing protein, partial [Hyphomicrobiales bacterium]